MRNLQKYIFSALLLTLGFSNGVSADEAVISYISGSGPYSEGTTVANIVISTDVNAGCRLNDIDDGDLSQWDTLSSTDSITHSTQITLFNDEDTVRYIRCKNITTNEINSTSYVFPITFDNDNTAPSISSSSIISATQDISYFYDVEATDPDTGDTLSFGLSTSPTGMTIDASTGSINWIPVNEQVGEQSVVVTVTDNGGLSDSQSFTITVINVNDAPTIISAAITFANENASYLYTVEATDPDPFDTLTYSLVAFPAGMVIDVSTGVINWTPGNEQIGEQAAAVVVTDSNGLTDTQNFTIIVSEINDVPVISSVAIVEASENTAYIYDVEVSDPNVGDILSFSVTTFPAGMTIDPSTGVITWTPTNDQVGNQSVVVVVTDSGGLTDSQSFAVTVINVNDAPSIVSSAITLVTQDIAYLYDVNATDPDAGDTLTFSLTTLPSGMTINPSTGIINWTPDNTQVGDQTITVIVTDNEGLTDSQTYTLVVSSVNDIGPVISYVSGSGPYPLGTTVANIIISTYVNAGCRFSDIDDGNIAQWSSLSTSDNLTHSAQISLSNNENTVRYIRCRTNGTSDINTISFVFSITFEEANNAPSMTSTAITAATQDTAYFYDVNATDPNANDILTFSLTASPLGMTINTSTGIINWIPTNEQVGNNDVAIVVTDNDGLSDSQSFTIMVANVNDAPNITSIAITSANESSNYVYDVDATDPDVDDILIFSLTTSPTGMSIDGMSGVINWTPTSEQRDDNDVVVVVSDASGLSREQSFTIFVNGVNEAPSISSIEITTASEDSVYIYDVEASDPNVGDTLTFSLNSLILGMAIDPVTGAINWIPTNDQVGNQLVEVIVTDDGGLFDSQIFTIVVTNVNDAPNISSSAITSASENTSYVYDVDATDADVGETLTFSLTSSPEGMTIDSSTGVINWTPSSSQLGIHQVIVVVTDLSSLSATQDFNITVDGVNQAPMITSSSISSVTQNTAYLYDIEATDPNVNDVLTFSLIDFPEGMNIDPSTGIITWMAPDVPNVGYDVGVMVTDSGGLSDTLYIELIVIDFTNEAPTIISTAITTAIENSVYVYDVEATDPNDPNDEDYQHYSLLISPSSMIIDSSTGVISWTPGSDEVGENEIIIVVDDAYGLSDTQEFIITVSGLADGPTIISSPVESATQNQIYVYDVDATDPNASDALTFSLSISPSGMNIDFSTGVINWIPDNSQVGDNEILVAVTDSTGLIDLQSFTITVSNVNDAPTIYSYAAMSATENIPYIYDVEATDPDIDDSLSFSLNTAPIGMNIDSLTGIINWTPTSAQIGSHGVSVMATDLEGLTDTQDFNIEVKLVDSDNDGIADINDQCPDTPIIEVSDSTGCSPSQRDSDNDGTVDSLDQCPDTSSEESADVAGCSISQVRGSYRSSKLPQTGADTVFDSFDDGALSRGTERSYTRNNDQQIVVDNTTGLIWQDISDNETQELTWNAAVDYCDDSVVGGITNWRIPSRLETIYLLDLGNSIDSDNAKIDSQFIYAAADDYWTSEHDEVSNVEFALFVDFRTAVVGQTTTTQTQLLRCVSGVKHFEPDFSRTSIVPENANIVIDKANRLMWQDNVAAEESELTYNEALEACENLELDGSTDWRLPNFNELHTTIEEISSNSNPIFKYRTPRTGSAYPYYWSSTSSQTNTDRVHVMWASPGSSDYAFEYKINPFGESRLSVRCIRDYGDPVAISGGDRSATVGVDVNFDASESGDPDGSIVSYRWYDPDDYILSGGKPLYLTIYSTESTFTSNQFEIGEHNIELEIVDNNGLIATDRLVLNIIAELNTAPTATSETVTINEDETVEIILQANDANGDNLTYEFVNLPTNGDVVLVSQNIATYTPDADYFGSDSFTFKVNDGEFDSNIATITISISSVNGGAPTAVASGNQIITLGGSVTLDASASFDDESIVSYEWSENGQILSTAISFTTDGFSIGTHSITLTVTDAEGLQSMDIIEINVLYELSQCNIEPTEDDYYFSDNYPNEDVTWSGANFSDVSEIEIAFNNARTSDLTLNQHLSLPDQAIWDSWNIQQKGLYLINSEREARSLKPYEGSSSQVVSVATEYADFMRNNHEAISHTRSSDGASPQDRLDENSDILNGRDGSIIVESLYATWAVVTVPTESESIVNAIYLWIYADKSSNWGHRAHVLQKALLENSGNSIYEEGIIGLGVSIGNYDPLNNDSNSQGAIVVLNTFDPSPSWNGTNNESVDISSANQCNNSIQLVVDESLIEVTNLKTISISPTNISLNPGDMQVLQVFGIYEDGSQQDLTAAVSFVADSNSVVLVDAGIITALNTGVVSLYAIVNGINSNRITVLVGEETDISNLTDTFAEDYLEYIPTNGTISHYNPKVFTLFNGLVLDRNNLPLADISISFHNRPEYGSVITDNEGRFTIAGEAGTRTIVYSKEGYVTLHRTINAVSNSWVTLADVILLVKDSKMTAIDLTSSSPQTHQSTIITDAYGSRATTLVFDNINQVTVTAQDGTSRVLDNFLVRATEAEFPQSMPSDLPIETAFTYCADLEIAGVGYQETVKFDNPVVMYVDNFLSFPVGEIVPIGYYTGNATNWKASDNGVVVKLLDSDSNGLVDGIDYTGDDIADDINGDGSTVDEVAGIENYNPGDLYWRGSFDHFTWYDFNWGWAEPIERLELLPPETNKEDPKDKDCVDTNSYVKPKPLSFHEDIAITGTNLTLHYSSQRTQDYHHKINVNVSGASLESGVIKMIAVLEIGGNRFEQTFEPNVFQDAEFIWDGKDLKGRVIYGAVRGNVSIGYIYSEKYLSAGNVATSGQPLSSFEQKWAKIGSEATEVTGRADAINWTTSPITLLNTPKSHIANGWSLSNHHIATDFDLVYLGNGESADVKPASLILKTGVTQSIYDGDDGYYQKGGSDINYAIDNNGILNDKVTGLQWEYLLQPHGFVFIEDAIAHCEGLNLGGEVANDLWRLPTSKEIAYSIDKSNSGHEFAIYRPEALNFWVEARVNGGGKIPLICVKGEKLDERYVQELIRNNTDEVVVDQENGLMWQDVAENSSETRDWRESINYCEVLDHAGFTDWRLPNINELAYSLPNNIFTYQTELVSGGEPWYPGAAFRKPYWSSTPDVTNDEVAWAIESASYTTGYTQDEQYYARCVRDDTTRSRSPYIFDQFGKHIKTIDLDSGITLTTFEYNDQDQLISVSDRFSNTITINRDGNGIATSIVSPDGYITDLTVNSNNNLTRTEYDDGTGYDFVYDGSLMTEETDPNSNLFVKTYNNIGRIEQTEDPEQGIWQFFNVKDEVEKIMSYGFTTSENNRFETVVSTLENGDISLITTAQDESVSEVIRQGDDLKETYISSGVVTVVDKILDAKTRLEIPQSITTTLPSGLENVVTIDKSYAENGVVHSQLTISITEDFQTSSMTENFVTGERIYTSTEGRIATSNYDPLTRQLESQQVSGFEDVNYAYDLRGRLKSTTIGDRITTFNYDDPISKGDVTSIIDAENRMTLFEYDALGRLNKTTYPDGRVLEQSFDGNGNLTSLTPPGQPQHIFNYNSVDKETQYTPPDVAGVVEPATVYDYDRDRKLMKVTRPDNRELIFNYKPNTVQLTSLAIPTGSYTYGYDANQELTSIIAPSGENLTFTLDGVLQTKEEWGGEVSGDAELIFNNQFQVVEQKINGGNSVLLGYDNDNLLTSAGSLVLERDVNNGLIVGTTQSNLTTSQSYNGYAEVLNYQASYNSTQLYNVDYTQDKLGRIIQQIETIEGITRTLDYDYDLAGRLIQVKTDSIETESYDYDDNGNRTHINGFLTATYDEQDRLLIHGDFAYTYTDNGELLTKTDLVNNEVTEYVYDVLGNLVEVNLPSGTKVEYVIDGVSRRVGKKINGVLVKGWLYQDQLNPIAELDGNSNIIARFVYGDKLNIPSFMEKNGQTYRIVSDHLGSPRLIVNVSTGVIEQRIDFDTWGNVTQNTNSEFQPFGFAGGLYDSQTKLTRFGARDYDASIGRWASKDLIRFEGLDPNLYGYVSNAPLNFIDRTGLVKEHVTNKTPSNLPKHQKGQARRTKDGGGEKGDKNRRQGGKRPKNWKGSWPPKQGGYISPALFRFLTGVGLFLYTPSLDCSNADCNGDGIPDWWENDISRQCK